MIHLQCTAYSVQWKYLIKIIKKTSTLDLEKNQKPQDLIEKIL